MRLIAVVSFVCLASCSDNYRSEISFGVFDSNCSAVVSDEDGGRRLGFGDHVTWLRSGSSYLDLVPVRLVLTCHGEIRNVELSGTACIETCQQRIDSGCQPTAIVAEQSAYAANNLQWVQGGLLTCKLANGSETQTPDNTVGVTVTPSP